jgi:uncharacterized membrane protein
MSVLRDRLVDRSPRRDALAALTRGSRPVWLLTALVFAVHATFGLARNARLYTAGYDLGIFDQMMQHYAHFKAPYVALKGPHYNLLGDHWHPILALFAPLYWIWDDDRTLLILQAALIALSVPVIHRVAARHVGRRVALAWTFAYGIGWPLQSMTGFDFHEVAVAVPLLALALDALDRTPGHGNGLWRDRPDRQLMLWCLLLLFVREDMGMLVMLIGLLRLLRGRPRRWVGGALVVGGVAAYLVVTHVLIPHFNPGGFAYWDYDALGPDLPHALSHIVQHPLDSAGIFFRHGNKWQTLVWLFLPFLFLSLRSPYVIVLLPLLAQRFFSSRPNLWGFGYHYSAPEWPILTIAAIDAVRRLRLRWRAGGRPLRCLTVWVAGVPVVGTAAIGGVFAFHAMVTGSIFRDSAEVPDQKAILAMIPPSTCVEADDRLIPRLTHTNLVSIPHYLGWDPDFIALDLDKPSPNDLDGTTQQEIESAKQRGYTLLAQRGPILLFQRPGYTGPSARCGVFGDG